MSNKNLKFLAIIGSNGSGKSACGGDIVEILGDENISFIGTYKKREGRQFYTGGADAFHGTSPMRQQEIRKLWMSDKPVVLSQGIIISSMTFMNFYQELQKEKYREIHIVYLKQPFERLLERITERSGREMSEKRYKGAKSRFNVIDNLYNKVKDNQNMIVKKFDMTEQNAPYEVRKYILESLGFGSEISRIIAIP